MSVRPNISSLKLDGTTLVVKGESEDPLPRILRVVVAQGEENEDGHCVEDGKPEKLVAGWTARFTNTSLKRGPAETMGIEVRANPLEIHTWFQSLEIE